MTLIAELDLTQDPAVVVTLYDYGEDHVPGHMKPPVYMDVTDEDPRPEPGYTYDGTTFAPGEPQKHEEKRQGGRAELEAAYQANEAWLSAYVSTGAAGDDQLAALTEQMNLLILGGSGQY
jgi:hypothetical protein